MAPLCGFQVQQDYMHCFEHATTTAREGEKSTLWPYSKCNTNIPWTSPIQMVCGLLANNVPSNTLESFYDKGAQPDTAVAPGIKLRARAALSVSHKKSLKRRKNTPQSAEGSEWHDAVFAETEQVMRPPRCCASRPYVDLYSPRLRIVGRTLHAPDVIEEFSKGVAAKGG